MMKRNELTGIAINFADGLLIFTAIFFAPRLIQDLFQFFNFEGYGHFLLCGVFYCSFLLIIYYGLNLPCIHPRQINFSEAFVGGLSRFAPIYIFSLAAGAIGSFILEVLAKVIPCIEPLLVKQDVFDTLTENMGNLPLFGSLVLQCVILAPVVEELIFRYFLYRSLKNRFPRRTAALISALIFAILHFNVIAFVPIFLVAMGLNATYERYQNLWPCFIIHSLFNLFGVLNCILLG